MAVGSLDNETVNLEPGLLKMSQPVDMPIFQLTDWNLDKKIFYGNKPGISMVLVMKRKITSEMMTTYFPTLLLTAITFATTFFKPFFFEAALSVNLTTMLVMTTIFISKMEGLPPTSDIKMIDIWLVLCQMVPFAEVVLLTAMEYRREDKKPGKKSKKKRKKMSTNLQTMSLVMAPIDDYRRDDSRGIIMMATNVGDKERNYSEQNRCKRCWKETNDNEEMEKICQKSWFPSLKIIGLLTLSYAKDE